MKAYAHTRNRRVYLRLGNDNMPREVGRIITKKDCKIFVSERNKSHVCIRHHAFGISKEVIELLLNEAVTVVNINYHHANGTITYYSLPLGYIIREGIDDTLSKDFAEQTFIPINKWKEMKA